MWPLAYSVSCGISLLQRSRARGQRVWNTHPDGGFTGEGVIVAAVSNIGRSLLNGTA